LKSKLTEISGKSRASQIDEILDQAGENRQESIAREVERLSETLGEKDIRDLNELLTWVIGAQRDLTIQELEAVLSVKNSERSLVPLESQIRHQYSALLEISDVDKSVTLVSNSITDDFQRERLPEEYQTSGARAKLHEAEVQLISKILRSVCGDEVFKKFSFEEFFKRKLGERGAMIDVNVKDAPIEILLCCLKVLCGEPNDKTQPLLDYAF
jgi:hypothetical protein